MNIEFKFCWKTY